MLRSSLCLHLFCFLPMALHASPTDAVREAPLSLRGLEYDPASQKLYGTSTVTNNLVQIDPNTGAITAAYTIGNTPSRVALSAQNGLWIGLDGDGAIRRFNLATFTAEEPIVIAPGAKVNDIAPSAVDSYTVVVSLKLQDGTDMSYVVSNGQLLPDTLGLSSVSLLGSVVYGMAGSYLYKADIGPNGLSQSLQIFGIPFGDVEPFEGFVYHPTGIIRRASDFQVQTPVPAGGADIAINKNTRDAFYISPGPEWTLHRYHLPTRTHTDAGAFSGAAGAGPFDLVVWSTNRAAFHTDSKLYLLHTDLIFVPAQLEVSQSIAPASPSFGSEVTVTVVVTNRGPGRALGVGLTNTLSGDAEMVLMSINGIQSVADETSALPTALGDIPAGASREYTFAVLPKSPGRFANSIFLGANNHLAPATNVLAFAVEAPTNGLIRFNRAVTEAVYAPRAGSVVAYDGARLWPLDPAAQRFGDVLANYPGATKLAAAPGADLLYLGYHQNVPRGGAIAQIPGTPWLVVGDPHYLVQAVDIEVSPQNPDLIAVSVLSPPSTTLYDSGALRGSAISQTGNLGFSPDGSKLYRNHSQDCSLSIYSVSPNGLTLDKTIPNVSCSDFAVIQGLLFFDSGLVYNPATESPSNRAPGLLPPVFFAASASGFDALVRTNGNWGVRRFRTAANDRFEEYAFRPLGPITDPVLDAFSAGPNRIAYRTSSELVVADLPPDPTSITATIQRGSGAVLIRFATTEGATYRVESTQTLGAPQWSAVRTNIMGTGAFITAELPLNRQAEFLRVVR